MPAWDQLWFNVNLITMNDEYVSNVGDEDVCEYGNGLGIIRHGAIATIGNKIAWLGRIQELTKPFSQYANQVSDVGDKWITPGLIDCHTHLIYAGNRSAEFSQRAHGLSYAQIANQGGGILSTVQATRQASFEQLYQQASKRLLRFLQEGVTTIEIKSGYGLDRDTEIKQLQIAQKLQENFPISIQRTFLGAHVIPPEYQENEAAYISFLCDKLLPEMANNDLLDAVDIFCEKIAFNLNQVEQIFNAAQKYSLKLKIHAEQLSNMNATVLAAKYKALSADHLEYLDEPGVAAMAENNMVAVLLPGAFYYLKEQQKPPLELLRQYKIPIAIASDCNPGSSPISSLQIIMNMACNLFNLSPEEALLGVTKNAARALGMLDRGQLKPGKKADFVLWDISHPAQLSYFLGENPCCGVVQNGYFRTNRHF